MTQLFYTALGIKDIIFPTLLVSGIALALGLVLGVVSKVFYFPSNKLEDDLKSVLPGANCGACGFTGCEGYAAYLADYGTDTSKCPVGGAAVAKDLSAILDVAPKNATPLVAHVMCNGTNDKTSPRYQYKGTMTCASSNALYSGPGSCTYGCIGYGDCVRVCPYNAIDIVGGIAVINDIKCKACELCVPECPKKIIFMVPKTNNGYKVECRNKMTGAQTRKICSVGCIGCHLCFKACPSDAITMEGPLAVIDQYKCTKCGKCYSVCPTKSISSPAEYAFNVVEKGRKNKKKG